MCTVRVEYHRSRPPSPGRETERPASKGRAPSSFPPDQTSIRPRRSPRSTGSETALGATIFSTTGRPTRTARTRGLRATSATARRPNGAAAHAYGCAATSLSVRYCETPQASSALQTDVAHRAGRAAQDHGIDRVAGTPRRGDLTPARVVRVTGLDPDEARKHAEQVVPRVHDEVPVLDRVLSLSHEISHDRRVHRHLCEHGDVARTRDVTRRVQPVRPHEWVSRSPRARARAFIQPTNCGTSPFEAAAASASAALFALWMSAPRAGRGRRCAHPRTAGSATRRPAQRCR